MNRICMSVLFVVGVLLDGAPVVAADDLLETIPSDAGRNNRVLVDFPEGLRRTLDFYITQTSTISKTG